MVSNMCSRNAEGQELVVEHVGRDRMPDGHTWALVERAGVTTAYVVSSLAERLARAAYSRASKSPAAPSA